MSEEVIMKTITILSILLSVALIQNVYADEVSHRKLTEEFLLIQNMDKQNEEIFKQMKQMQMSSVGNMDGAEEIKFNQAKMWDLMAEEMGWEKLKNDYIDIYIDIFSEEELQGLINFYKSPIGMKLVEKQPELLKSIMLMSQKHSMQLMPKLQQLMMEDISQRTQVQSKGQVPSQDQDQ
jgi:uncharacterized protein